MFIALKIPRNKEKKKPADLYNNRHGSQKHFDGSLKRQTKLIKTSKIHQGRKRERRELVQINQK